MLCAGAAAQRQRLLAERAAELAALPAFDALPLRYAKPGDGARAVCYVMRETQLI